MGTRVNNQSLAGEQLLLTGDLLEVGDTQLLLSSDLLSDTTDDLPTLKPRATPSASPAFAVQPVSCAPLVLAKTHGVVQSLARLTNTTLGYLTLGPLLGVGRSGAVFRAVDTRDQSPVAVKVFIPEFSNSEQEVLRFVRAAKTIMPLRNLNVVDFYNAGRMNGHCWASMELIEGPSLAWHVQQSASCPTQWGLARRVLRDVTRALVFLHGKRIVHRNLSPENLLVNSGDGLVKVGDLIAAKAQEGKLAEDVTCEGHVVGEIHYLAPERTFGGPSSDDARSDLYSLGAVVYALLTGRPPLQGKTTLDTLEKIRTRVPTPLRQELPGAPPALDAVVNRLLAKDPAHRFKSAKDLLRHLVENKLMD
jgi:serine/threonine protein kinase